MEKEKEEPLKNLKKTTLINIKIHDLYQIVNSHYNNTYYLDSLFNKKRILLLILYIFNKTRKNNEDFYILNCFLRRYQYFTGLVAQERALDNIIKRASNAFKAKSYRKNSIIYHVGDIVSKFFLVIEGEVCILIPEEKELSIDYSDYLSYLQILYLFSEDYLLDHTIKNNEHLIEINKDDIKKYKLQRKILRSKGNIDINIDSFIKIINGDISEFNVVEYVKKIYNDNYNNDKENNKNLCNIIKNEEITINNDNINKNNDKNLLNSSSSSVFYEFKHKKYLIDSRNNSNNSDSDESMSKISFQSSPIITTEKKFDFDKNNNNKEICDIIRKSTYINMGNLFNVRKLSTIKKDSEDPLMKMPKIDLSKANVINQDNITSKRNINLNINSNNTNNKVVIANDSSEYEFKTPNRRNNRIKSGKSRMHYNNELNRINENKYFDRGYKTNIMRNGLRKKSNKIIESEQCLESGTKKSLIHNISQNSQMKIYKTNVDNINDNNMANNNINNNIKMKNSFKISLKILGYSIAKTLGEGEFFGESEFMKEVKIRENSVFVKDNSILVKMNNNQYTQIIKSHMKKKRVEDILFVLESQLFGNNLSYTEFLNKYWQFFDYKILSRGDYLFKANECSDKIYFIEKGEISIFSNLNYDEISRIVEKLKCKNDKEYNNFLAKEKEYENCKNEIMINPSHSKYLRSRELVKFFLATRGNVLGLGDVIFVDSKYFCSARCESINASIFCLEKNIFYWMVGEIEGMRDSIRRVERMKSRIMGGKLSKLLSKFESKIIYPSIQLSDFANNKKKIIKTSTNFFDIFCKDKSNNIVQGDIDYEINQFIIKNNIKNNDKNRGIKAKNNDNLYGLKEVKLLNKESNNKFKSKFNINIDYMSNNVLNKQKCDYKERGKKRKLFDNKEDYSKLFMISTVENVKSSIRTFVPINLKTRKMIKKNDIINNNKCYTNITNNTNKNLEKIDKIMKSDMSKKKINNMKGVLKTEFRTSSTNKTKYKNTTASSKTKSSANLYEDKNNKYEIYVHSFQI